MIVSTSILSLIQSVGLRTNAIGLIIAAISGSLIKNHDQRSSRSLGESLD